MTIRDQEVLEALREEPELLAIADAVTETQRLPHRSHRRTISGWAAVAAVGATAVLVGLLWPSGGGSNRILDRALAAIGNRPVLHLVVRMPVGEQLVDIRTGRTTAPTYEVETWGTRDFKRFHMIMRLNGRIVAEVLLPQDGGAMPLAKVNPAYAALWTGYGQALADGTAKIERTGRLYGHNVYWLTFPGLGRTPARNEVAIDRKTYEPLDFRFHVGSRVLDNQALLARTEQFNAAAFTRLTRRPNPFSGGTHSSGVQVAPVQSSRPGKPWLRAGPAIAGVKLATVHRTQTTTGGRTSLGYELVYGSEGTLRRSILVDEAKHPTDRSEWKGIPKGLMRVTEGDAAEGGGAGYPLWTGNLVVRGVYVSIQTGLGRSALLEAARALRPAGR